MNTRKKLIKKKKRNFCSTFVLPMCNINHKNLPSNFIDSYIDLEYNIFMVFDKTDDYDIIFHTFLKNTISYNNCYNSHVEEEDEIVIKLSVPLEHYGNYDKFINGEYSKMDDFYKKTIVRYFGNTTIKDNYEVTEYNVIYPQDFKRKQIAERLYSKKDLHIGLKLIHEVLDKPDLDRELYKPLQILLQENDQLNKQNTETI